jgi:hypothetical protein
MISCYRIRRSSRQHYTAHRFGHLLEKRTNDTLECPLGGRPRIGKEARDLIVLVGDALFLLAETLTAWLG